MKRYIRAATKNVGGQSYTYTSLSELKQMLKSAGILGNRKISPVDESEIFRSGIEFVSGLAEIVVFATSQIGDWCKFEIYRDGEQFLKGSLRRLFDPTDKLYLKYTAACQAAPDKFASAVDDFAINKKYKAALARENKKLSDQEIYEVIRPFSVSQSVALEAIREFRYQVTDEDWSALTSWRLSKVDSKAESWASLPMQAYGTHYTYVIQLDTPYNTYTTNVRRTEGWYTE